MKKVTAAAISGQESFNSRAIVSRVCFEWNRLVIEVVAGGDGKVARIEFNEVLGFRLLDEGDLLEFWPACSSARGWLFLVQENGWFDHELSRPGFIREKGPGILEYFVAGQNGCVSVLSGEEPSVVVYQI